MPTSAQPWVLREGESSRGRGADVEACWKGTRGASLEVVEGWWWPLVPMAVAPDASGIKADRDEGGEGRDKRGG